MVGVGCPEAHSETALGSSHLPTWSGRAVVLHALRGRLPRSSVAWSRAAGPRPDAPYPRPR
eukprot:1397465-Pyramimonas_sp.AAC.1